MLSSYEELLREAEAISRRFERREIPRPPFWSGFRLVPESFEFWYGRPGRLHERRLYVREGGRWNVSLLYP
jgi:pyridoxamine 5'-phosphate oxidase